MKRFLLLFAVLAAPAGSQAAPPGRDITGSWRFETSSFGGCRISGAMTIKPPTGEDARACSFIAESVCARDGKETEYWRVQESCTALKTGAVVTITSKIDKVLARRPLADDDGFYVADNFALTAAPDFATMAGSQIDAERRLSAKFWRDGGPTS